MVRSVSLIILFRIQNLIFLGGITIHGAFDFRFGNEITFSSEKKLTELRKNLSELQVIIIDNISLVSSNMLCKIDAKLKEIFILRRNIPFAGIGIMLLGDLLQIPPVRAGYIFGKPSNDKSAVEYDIVQYEGVSLLTLLLASGMLDINN